MVPIYSGEEQETITVSLALPVAPGRKTTRKGSSQGADPDPRGVTVPEEIEKALTSPQEEVEQLFVPFPWSATTR